VRKYGVLQQHPVLQVHSFIPFHEQQQYLAPNPRKSKSRWSGSFGSRNTARRQLSKMQEADQHVEQILFRDILVSFQSCSAG
jgi:hypothetical protein